MGQRHFSLNEEQRKEYAAGVILDLIHNDGRKWGVVLDRADQDLEPLLVYMLAKEYLELDEKKIYHATAKGVEKLENLKRRYEEYLSHFDIYSAVDLENGSFAFEKIFDLDDDAWEDYVQDERFSDLRIAVAWFKKINPADFVFLSFLKEGYFDTHKEGWQFDLLSGLTWRQIEEIVDNAIQLEDLGYMGEDSNWISGEEVITDVLSKGSHLNAELHAEEERLNQMDHDHPNDYHDDSRETTFVTYERYYDPFYISPIWFLF